MTGALTIPLVGNEAHLGQAEPLPRPVDHRQQRRDVRLIPRSDLAVQRSSALAEQGAHHDLVAVWTVVLGVAVGAQLLAALALEVQARRVEEHEVKGTEQVLRLLEQPLLHRVSVLSQETHRPVQVVQLKVVGSRHRHIAQETQPLAIGARLEQAVQDGRKHRSLHVEGEPSPLHKVVEDHVQPAVGPQSAEDLLRPDVAYRQGTQTPLGVCCLNTHLVREATQGTHPALDLALLLQLVQASEGGDDALAGAAVFPAAFHELDVVMTRDMLRADEHRHVLAASYKLEVASTSRVNV